MQKTNGDGIGSGGGTNCRGCHQCLRFSIKGELATRPYRSQHGISGRKHTNSGYQKQHEAQAQGYYEGGFTGGNHYRREAGVVHEGEFVANHQAVRNPAILPVLNIIDQAQRTNRVASLTAADVSRAITAPSFSASAVTAADNKPTVTVVDTAQPRTAEALEKLTAQIDEGITAVVTIDGPNGFARQWKNTTNSLNYDETNHQRHRSRTES